MDSTFVKRGEFGGRQQKHCMNMINGDLSTHTDALQSTLVSFSIANQQGMVLWQ